MDLIDFSKRIAKLNNQHKYVLIAVDLYNRQAFTQAMPRKTAQATLEAFRKIIRKNDGNMPNEITVDLGQEHALLEKEITDNGGVLRRKNVQAVNTLAVVDRAIAKLKTILSSYSLTNWADALQKATNAYNERSHSYLMGSAPDDVKDSKTLQYELDKSNGEHILHNNKQWRQKAGRLKDEGAFRVPTDRKTWERIDAPKFAGEVLPVTGLKGANVESGDKSFPVKTVLAVPAGSANVDLADAGPGQGKRAKQREVLGDYARDLHKSIPVEGLTLPTVRVLLQGMRGLEDTMDTYGPARAGRYVAFLKLFPSLFKVTGSGPGLRVMKADPPPPREPRPAQPANSSTERAPRVELGPRAVYRRFFNEIPVVYAAENPARRNSQRYQRYENYKKATTIGQARALGATSQDISPELSVGAVKVI